jgi:hypothetical protein
VADFHRILPCIRAASSPAAVDKGWRLRVTRMDGENCDIVEEQVLPERALRPDAHRILATLGAITLTADEVRWLRDQLAELLPIMERQDADDQAKIDARRTRKIVDVAKRVGEHWRHQEGVNSALLDELAEATR